MRITIKNDFPLIVAFIVIVLSTVMVGCGARHETTPAATAAKVAPTNDKDGATFTIEFVKDDTTDFGDEYKAEPLPAAKFTAYITCGHYRSFCVDEFMGDFLANLRWEIEHCSEMYDIDTIEVITYPSPGEGTLVVIESFLRDKTDVPVRREAPLAASMTKSTSEIEGWGSQESMFGIVHKQQNEGVW